MKYFYVVSYNDKSGCNTNTTCYAKHQIHKIVDSIRKFATPESTIDIHYYECNEEIVGDRKINKYLDSFFYNDFEPSENIIETIKL